MSSQPGSPAAPSRAGGKKLPVIVATLLALGGGGYVAWGKLAAPPPAVPVVKKVVREPGVLELEPFVQNLSDPTGDRYFRLNLRLVLDQRAIAERAAVGLAEVKLRDRILALLAKKRATQLTSVAGKELLRTEIRETTEALLGEPPFFVAASDAAPAHVVDVLFMEFLVQ
jgi:flagellar basal body-associated protein FliL